MNTQGQENYGGASGKDDGGLTTGGDGREEMAQAQSQVPQNQVPSAAGIENRATTDALPDDDLTGAQMDSAMDSDGAGGNPLDDDPESGSMGTDITGGSGQGGMVAGDAAGVVGSSISGDAVGAAAGADIDPEATTQGSDRSDETPGYGNSPGYDDAGQSRQGGAPGSDGTSSQGSGGMSSEGMNSGGAGSGSSNYGGGQQQQSSQQGGFKTQGEREGEDYADDLGDGASASSAGGGL